MTTSTNSSFPDSPRPRPIGTGSAVPRVTAMMQPYLECIRPGRLVVRDGAEEEVERTLNAFLRDGSDEQSSRELFDFLVLMEAGKQAELMACLIPIVRRVLTTREGARREGAAFNRFSGSRPAVLAPRHDEAPPQGTVRLTALAPLLPAHRR